MLDKSIEMVQYTKSARKGTTHAWESDTSSITAISNLPVQIFEHMYGYQFCAKSQGQALHPRRFALLTLSPFLCTLSHPPRTTDDGSMLTLTHKYEYLLLRYQKGSYCNDREEEKGCRG